MNPHEILRQQKCKLIFKWLGKYHYGEFERFTDETKPSTIAINIWLHIVETFIHECLHYLHPRWKSEQRIEKKTQRIIKRMTVNEIKELGDAILIKFFLNGEKKKMKRPA